MNELRRRAYLAAMGIDAYASRRQLPGAASSRPVAVAIRQRASQPRLQPQPPSPVERPPVLDRPLIEIERTSRATPDGRQPVPQTTAMPRFSLVAIVAGEWLWLEELHSPLTTEQVQLVRAMALALGRFASADQPGEVRPDEARPGEAQPIVARFQWPMHNNRQLDLGEEAARASVAGFVARKLEQHNCRGLVLLGRACGARIAAEQLQGVGTVQTFSSAELLRTPSLKQQAWCDLLAITRGE